MTKLSSTLLLIGVCLLTAVVALGNISPLAWLLVYVGWMMLFKYLGQAMLADVQAEKLEAARVPGARPAGAQGHTA